MYLETKNIVSQDLHVISTDVWDGIYWWQVSDDGDRYNTYK